MDFDLYNVVLLLQYTFVIFVFGVHFGRKWEKKDNE